MRLEFGGEDMFVVVVYDVHSSRCNRVMKYLRQWLEHRQRSVFSGFLTKSQLKTCKKGLKQRIKPKHDSVIFFESIRANQINEWCTQAADDRRLSAMIGASHAADTVTQTARRKPRFRFSPLPGQ